MKKTFPGYTIPETLSPPGRKCFQVQVPDDPDHIQAFFAQIEELSYWYNWQHDAAHSGKTLALVWYEVWRHIEECTPTPPVIPPTPPLHFMEVDTDMTSFRQTDCKLEVQCADGSWDTIYDPSTCIDQRTADAGAQGGDHAPPDYGHVTTKLVIQPAKSMYLYPYKVNPGDSVAITNATGAMSEGAFPANWHCPSGDYYTLGECSGSGGAAGGGFPMTAQPKMRLLALYNGVYYDAFNTTFTIPTSAAQSDLFFTQNDTDISDNQGSFSYNVTVTRPPAPSVDANLYDWQIVFDLKAHQYATVFHVSQVNGNAPTGWITLQGYTSGASGWIIQLITHLHAYTSPCLLSAISITARQAVAKAINTGEKIRLQVQAAATVTQDSFSEFNPALGGTHIFTFADEDLNAVNDREVDMRVETWDAPGNSNQVWIEKVVFAGKGVAPTILY